MQYFVVQIVLMLRATNAAALRNRSPHSYINKHKLCADEKVMYDNDYYVITVPYFIYIIPVQGQIYIF